MRRSAGRDPAEPVGPIEPMEAGGAAPTAAPTARPRRIRRDVLVGAAGLIALALVGKALSSGSGAPSSRRSSPSASRSIAAPTGPVALPPPVAGDVAACPQKVRCLTQEAGNGLALEPVRSRLPRAAVVRFRTVLLQTAPWQGRLWYRELGFRLPDGSPLDVRISAPLQPTAAQTGRVGTESFAVASIGRYEVRVTAPKALGLRPDVLPSIAADERLLTT